MFWAVVGLAFQLAGLPAGDRLYAEGKFPEAIEEYERLLAEHPGHPGILLRLGASQYEVRAYAAAEASFRQALEGAPDLQPALTGLGATLIALGKAVEAIKPLERAVELAPADPMARRSLGHAYAETGELVKGEAVLGKLVEEDPSDWESWYYLGALFFDQNYSAPALEALDKALALYSDNWRAKIYRAGALSQLGRLDEAEEAFKRLSADPRAPESSEYLLGYAQLHFRLGNYEESLALVEKALASNPDSAKLQFWKGRSLHYMGKTGEALEATKRAVDLAPGLPNARNLLLRLYRIAGDHAKAAEQADWLRQHEDKVAAGTPR